MLKERQQSILKAVIQEYIDTARPVASQDLAGRFRLGVSPATVRNDMLSLDKLGYLEQPHTSAGRIPTDKGLRFFLDNFLQEESLSPREQSRIRRRFRLQREEEFVMGFGETISQISGMFTMAGGEDEGYLYETGLSKVFQEPEFQNPEMTRVFGRIVDTLARDLRSWMDEHGEDEENIFIGDESPWKEGHDCSLFFSHWRHPRGFGGFLAMIGPRRTDYGKQKAILNFLKKLSYAR